jgi:hypothetical protein
LDRVGHSGQIGGPYSESEQSQADARIPEAERKLNPLFEQELGDLRAVMAGHQSQQAQRPMQPVELRFELIEVSLENGDPAGSQFRGDLRLEAGLPAKEREIILN